MMMIKVLEIRKVIFSLINTVTPNAYYQDAPENTPTPYVTVDISNSIDDGTLERFVMDIDGWGISNNTAALETLMHNIDDKLHRKTVYITNADGKQLGITFYRENRLTFHENDKRIFRRRNIYQIRTHQK